MDFDSKMSLDLIFQAAKAPFAMHASNKQINLSKLVLKTSLRALLERHLNQWFYYPRFFGKCSQTNPQLPQVP